MPTDNNNNNNNINESEPKNSQLRTIFNKTSILDFIAIPTQNKIDFIKYTNIIYLKSEGRYTHLILEKGKKITVAKNLGKYDDTISEIPYFFRIHKSYLINLNHVLSIDVQNGFYCEMSNGDFLPISKRKRIELKEYLRIN